ncbi:MAG: apolipoprotein N-acyltransferase, partial [Verrucomicrobiota bacterium]
AYTGAGGVSFTLVAMNLGFAAYAHRLWFENQRGLWRRSPEFLMALALLLTCLGVHLSEAVNRAPYAVPLVRVAFVQPDIPQEVKWDPSKRDEILAVLGDVTRQATALKPGLILWPEATTPLPLNADAALRAQVERLVREAGAPLALGSIALLPGADGRPETAEWLNAAYVVDPATGMQERIYAKRKLVPFGEYVPLRPLFGWLGKFVPIGDDFARGESATPLAVHLPGQPAEAALKAGTLICYEDIFPALARASTQAGADVLVVHTNNAWYGEGGMAYQHAAHSVLRAVETRRPVLRDGNAGWSGWIDEFGTIRAVVTRDAAGNVSASPAAQDAGPAARGTVYFRGAAATDVTRDSRWIGRQSFYTEHGDWFVTVSAALALAAWLAVRREAKPPRTQAV